MNDEPGDHVGIRSAQSVLRAATQSNLSYFHVAGMETNVHGNYKVPNIADTMDTKYTNYNTSATFNLLPTSSNTSIKKYLVGKKFIWFVTLIRSNITELPDIENIWYETSDKQMYNGIIIRFYINYEKLIEYGLTLYELALSCFKGDIDWHVSPDFMGMIDVNVTDGYPASIIAMTNNIVCGTMDITSCSISQNQVKRTVTTTGSNIIAISKIPDIDKTSIVSNHIKDVEENFGIEAANFALNKIIDSDVISDFMTRTGKVLSFYNSSTEISAKGVLTSIAFERTKQQIKKALYNSNWDKHASIYADIMVGKDPNNMFDIHTNKK